MSEKSKIKRLEKEKRIINSILWIPIVFILAIVPLIIRVTITNPDKQQISILRLSGTLDFFSQGKAVLMLISTVVMVVMLFFLFHKEWVKWDRKVKVYIGSSMVFIVMSVIATLFSDYKSVAVWGIYDRAEGVITLICYIASMFYTIYIYNNERHMKYAVTALCVLIGMTTIIGAFQYWGKDPILTEWIKNIIMPKSYSEYELIMVTASQSGRIYGAMYHYNYMGSFGAMMLPLFTGLTLFERDKKKKVILAFFTVCAAFLLFGSTSRAGLVGLCFAVIIALAVFGKNLISKWRLIGVLLLAGGLLIGVFNSMTKGAIFERVPTLIEDAFGLFGKSDTHFNYKDHLPIKDLIIKGKKATVILQDSKLILEYIKGAISFKDQNGVEVDYSANGNRLTTKNVPFEFISFELRTGDVNNDGIFEDILVMYVDNNDLFVFKYDDTEGVYLVNSYTLEKEDITYPETFGFKGKEKLGSARGYIWSRSIPMLKDTWLIGHGPDTFPLEFPQADMLGKWWAYDTPKMTVDKPHNMYLQYGINNGGVALLAFLTLIITYVVNSIRLYAFKKDYTSHEGKGIAVLLAVAGYLGAGIFNDSVVSVAPVFWVLLGLGIAINNHNEKRTSSLL